MGEGNMEEKTNCGALMLLQLQGEVTSGGRWPPSEEANLPCVQPAWESSHTLSALRIDPEVIQRLGKTFHKRKLGGDSITMSHMEKLFDCWGGSILGNRRKMWSRNYQLILDEIKLPLSRKRRE